MKKIIFYDPVFLFYLGYFIGIVDKVNDLGAMAWVVAPELFCKVL